MHATDSAPKTAESRLFCIMINITLDRVHQNSGRGRSSEPRVSCVLHAHVCIGLWVRVHTVT